MVYFSLRILRVLLEVDEVGFGRFWAVLVDFLLEQVFDSLSSFIFAACAIGFVARKSIDVLSEL